MHSLVSACNAVDGSGLAERLRYRGEFIDSR
jgi:hypothetical protein